LLFHGLPPLVIAFGARYLNRFLHETEHYYDNRYKNFNLIAICHNPATLRISCTTILQVFLIAKYMRIKITNGIGNQAIDAKLEI
jgi:hypothetical protein